jgi:Uncharacterized protein conserved in bacteria (DUF2334)
VILFLAMLFTGLVSVSATAQKYVVFRDDDTGYGTVEALEAVNQVHIDENVPVTLAIIPHPDLSGTGNELLWNSPVNSYLQSIVTNSLFEFAQHGYTHYNYAQNGAPGSSASIAGAGVPQVVGAAAPYYAAGESPGPGQNVSAGSGVDSEFWGRTYADQYNAIKQGRDDITQAFGVTPTTFVPPWNKGDDNTLKATKALGFTLYSTSTADFNVREAVLQGIAVQGESTGLGWDTYANWETGMQQLTQATDTWLDSAAAGDHYVVGYHSWAFENSDGTLDTARIALFKQYIDHLKDRGDVLFTTLGGQGLGGGWGGWAALGGQLAPGTSPAICAQDAKSLDVLVRGTDNALWYKHYQAGSGWSGWETLGGVLTSDPAAVSQSAGKIDVAVRGSDGALWTRSTTNGGSSWSGWSKIGGQLLAGTGPAAYAWGDTRLGWMVTGTDKALWHMWKDSSGTHSWQSLGGVLTSSPGATSSASGAIDVFVRGNDNALWQRGYSNNAWGGWAALSGQLASGTGPAACSWGAGRLDVFVQGTEGALWHKWAAGGWSAWEPLGGKLTSSPAAAGSGGNRIDVSVRGTDSALWWKSYLTN